MRLPFPRNILLSCAVLAVALALAGCSGGDGTSTDPATTTSDAPADSGAAAVPAGDLPLISTAEEVETWQAPLFNFPEEELTGRLAQLPEGTDPKGTLNAQVKQLENADWTVAELEFEDVTADANGQCDPRVFSIVGDDASIAAVENGLVLVADSPDDSIRALYFIGSSHGIPNFMYRAREEWPAMSALRSVNGDAVVTLAAPKQFSRGILWGNFEDGLGDENVRIDSPDCREDLETEPFGLE